MWRCEFDGTHAGQKIFFSGVEQTIRTLFGNADDVGTSATVDRIHLGASGGGSLFSRAKVGAFLVYSPAIALGSDKVLVENYVIGRGWVQ